MRRSIVSQRGVSLLEVLIAIVVFSLGLLGLLSAAALTIRTNHEAYSSTQAINVADFLIGAMRRNPLGVATQQYNGALEANDIYASTPVTARACLGGATCNPGAQAIDDRTQAEVLMGQHFPPGAKGNIICSAPTALPSIVGLAAPNTRPPYNGRCTLEIEWAIDRAGTKLKRIWTLQP